MSHIEGIKDEKSDKKYDGQWYYQVINKVVSNVDCYEIIRAGHGLLKKDALFADIELDKWADICDTCINNPDKK